MSAAVVAATTTRAFLDAVAQWSPPANGHTPVWLGDLRRAAFDWVASHGLPTTDDDDFRYTRVEPILRVPFAPAVPGTNPWLSTGDVARLAPDLGGPRLVFVNGSLSPDLSSIDGLPRGAVATSLAARLLHDDTLLKPHLERPLVEHPNAFSALNVALATDGAFIQVPARMTLREPIHLVFISDAGDAPLASHHRSLILVGASSHATVVETHVGPFGQVYLANAITQVVLDDGATLDHVKIQNESQAAFHFGLVDSRQGRDTRFATHAIAIGAALGRHEVHSSLDRPGGSVALFGLSMPQSVQHLDSTTTIEHVAPGCTSREVYKGIVDDHGSSTFSGRIVVHPGAAKTDAAQTNKNLLLSDSAQAITRPRLEILADDVKCAHGATVGKIDDDAMFYLRSRGVPAAEARGLLIFAFALEMVDRIPVASAKEHVARLVRARLPGDDGAQVAA